MRHHLLASVFVCLGLSTSAQNVDWNPYGIADCSGNGVGIHYTFSDPQGIMVPDSAITITAHIGGVMQVIVLSQPWQAGDTLIEIDIALPPISVNPIVLDSIHRVSATYYAYQMGNPSLVEQNNYVDFLPMFCEFEESCQGNLLTSTGGDIVWLNADGDTLAINDSLYVFTDTIVEGVPSALLHTRFDDWTSYVQFVEPIEWVSVLTVSDDTCNSENGSLAAFADGGVEPYQYSWDTGETTLFIDGLASGVYTVNVVDAIGCMREATGVVADTCGISTSMEEVAVASLQIYPNPTTDEVTIIAPGHQTYRIANLLRQTVIEGRLADRTPVDVASLETGVYFVELSPGSSSVQTLRLIKK